jgi:transposase
MTDVLVLTREPDKKEHGRGELSRRGEGNLPALIERAGPAAVFAAEEFFRGKIRNPHTRAAYERAVRNFLAWCDSRGLELHTISPKHVGEYMEGLGSISKEHQHLATLRHFFDVQVQRHAVILNPALSVRGQRYEVVEGKTPEIPVADARRLLSSLDTSHVVGLRDRAALAILAYTGCALGLSPSSREKISFTMARNGHFAFKRRAESRGSSRCVMTWSGFCSSTSTRQASAMRPKRSHSFYRPCEKKSDSPKTAWM